MMRLEALAFAASVECAPQRGKHMLRTKLLTLLNDEPLRAFAEKEDPCENFVTQEFVAEDRGFTYFAGILEDPDYHLRIFWEALQHIRATHSVAELGLRTMRAALLVSDTIARRAGLPRGTPPIFAHWQKVHVPSDDEVRALAQTVRFEREDLIQLLSSAGLSWADISPLILDAPPRWEDYVAQAGPYAQPIVDVGGTFVVAIPSALPYAAREAVLIQFHEANALEVLASALRGITFREVVEDLDDIGFAFSSRLELEPNEAHALAAAFDFDLDKQACLIFLHDPLTDYAPGGRSKTWDSARVVEEINQQIPRIEDQLLSQDNGPTQLLFLFVVAGVHRRSLQHWKVAHDRRGSVGAAFQAADLAPIAHLDAHEPLSLWGFATSKHMDQEFRRPVTVDPMARYVYWRSPSRAHVHDELPVGAVLPVMQNIVGDFKRESLRIQDRHAAWHPLGRMAPVRRVYRWGFERVYAIDAPDPGLNQLLVEGFSKPIWIISASDAEGQPPMRANGFGTTIASWLNYAPAKELNEVLDRKQEPALILVVSCENEAPDLSFGEDSEGAVHVVIGRSFLQTLFHNPEQEALLLAQVIDLVSTRSGVPEIAEPIVKRILELAPSHMIPVLSQAVVAIRPDLPEARCVQSYAADWLMDDLARREISCGEKGPRQLERVETRQKLGDAAAWLMERLESRVKELAPDALDRLVFHYELIVNDANKRYVGVPFQHQLRGSQAQTRDPTLQELSDAAGACRYLIEYVTARPPRGSHPLSLSAFDELLALASHVLLFKHHQNMVVFGLVDVRGRISPSLRPMFTAPDFSHASKDVEADTLSQELEHAQDMLDAGFPTDVGEVPKDFAMADAAFHAEWGLGFLELGFFFDAIAGLAEGTLIARMPEEDVAKRLAEELGWPREKVEAALRTFSLAPREKFIDGPDTEPWRHRRRRSYMMRPLLSREIDGIRTLTWGPLQVTSTPNYIVNLVLEARLTDPQSDPMKSFLGELREKYEGFNLIVKEAFDDAPEWKAHNSVDIHTIFGGPKIGDIDTLALHYPSRTAYLIEAKSWAVGRVPHDWRQEISKLFQGKDAAIPKHAARVEWAAQNVERIKERYRLEGNWQVLGLVVLDRPILGAALRETPFKILSFKKLKERIPTGRLT